MAGKAGHARFFCEQCGAEVRAGAAACPSCGSRFSAVRCPKCGYEGTGPEFRDGCPVCGYGMGAEGRPSAPAAPPGRRARPHRGMPRAFSRLAVAILALLIVVLAAVLLLSK